jgi:diguanylate cyclase (GGDEF)-like protein
MRRLSRSRLKAMLRSLRFQVTLAVLLSAGACAFYASKVSHDELGGAYFDSSQEVLDEVVPGFGSGIHPEQLARAKELSRRAETAVSPHRDVSSVVILWPAPSDPRRFESTAAAPPSRRLVSAARRVLTSNEVVRNEVRAPGRHFAERVSSLEWRGRPVAALALSYDLHRFDRALAARTRRIAIVLGALLLAFTAFTALILTRGIFGPLLRLRHATHDIRSGKLSTRLGWTRRDELGVVAADFDSMASELEEQHRRLEALARADSLTGLANHRQFQEVLDDHLKRAGRTGGLVSLALLDIDHFKQLNDLHGHPLGDQVLARVGERLAETLDGVGFPARLGGDEFAIVLPDISGERAQAVLELAQEAASGAPIDGRDISCSVGFACYPEDATNASALLELADGALYWAKRSGRGGIRRYDRERVLVVTEEQRAEFAAVVEEPGMVTTVFQPIVALATAEIEGYEALSRFVDEHRRVPSWWFHQAHRFGLGHRLEAEAVRRALSTPERPADAFVSVNVSPSALANNELQSHFPDDLSDIVIEITEHEQITDEDAFHAALDPLRGRGVTVAIDDAGAGYASLRQVMRLRAELIKLDRGLVENVDQDPTKAALVSSLVDFARHTGARLCAEGIETLEELTTLRELGVAWGQGYFLAKPGPAWPLLRPEVRGLLGRETGRRLKAVPVS